MRTRCASLVATIICLSASWAHAQSAETTLASAARDGRASGKNSEIGGISTTGRFVAFDSKSPDFVKGDTNNSRDVFIRDLEAGKTKRVNVSSSGRETRDGGCHCNISSSVQAMSDDGSLVGFVTRSPTLDEDDHDSHHDGFVHDAKTGETQMVTGNRDEDATSSVSAISPTGRFVAYSYEPDDGDDARIYLWDRKKGGRRWINLETGGHPPFAGRVVDISADGDKVTFVTDSFTESTGEQVWVMDQTTGVVTQVSVSSNEEYANNYSAGGDMSPDGRYVLFESYADNLMGVGGDKNFIQDVFLRDLEAGTTTLVSLREDGMQSLQGWHWAGRVSDDGCKAVFESDSSDMVANDTNATTDVFVRNICAETTTRVSVASDGTGGNASSYRAMLSGDGLWAAFQSRATNLAPEDGNQKWDVFVRGPLS